MHKFAFWLSQSMLLLLPVLLVLLLLLPRPSLLAND
jgi:hypothetical protein